MKERVLSGMQPSGILHIGNLVGALQNWVKLQTQYECLYCVVDLHALTTNYTNPQVIGGYVNDMVVNFIAAGLDPQKCTIFLQSKVHEHAELHLLLSMITPLGWLERVPTYKEKQTELVDRDINTYGFLGYPVLQAADILIYRAKYVPVGFDQLPHLEITREIARRFHFLYKSETLVEPEALLTEYPKVLGVDGRKMSKSYDNAIYMSDSPEVVDKKIRTMMTDPARKRRTDVGNPDVCPVYQLHTIFSNEEEQGYAVVGCRSAAIGCIDCKKVLIKNIFAVLEPIWTKRKELINKPDIVRDIIEEGSRRASVLAKETLDMVKGDMSI
ncbi:MAG: tryptophan--tRNA ligase [Candidatus Magnetoovum sp. WYHC-5]|nr:tryptophan--tRNA ligase [Candidatus Magnetoovum sp. WYHC-5]